MRGRVWLVSVGIAGLALVAGAAVATAGDRPNILLLVAEDLSPRIGAFGDPVAVTPRLDALAREGVRYTRVFTTAGVCAPSRAALITGLHQISIGGQHMRTSSRPEGGYRAVPPPGVKAFPELLRQAGYFTFTDAKFDYQFSGAVFDPGAFTIWNETGSSASWRDRSDPSQPFFGMVNFGVTHESGVFQPLGSWPHSLTHLTMQLMRAFTLGFPEDGPVGPEDVVLPPYYPDTPAVRSDVARFYDNIHVMDRQVGELLDRLEADGLADSTIVIWTTDHGDGLPRAKRELYDSGILVPMIVRWPEALRPANAEPGSIDAQLVSFVDLAATILALAKVPRPAPLQGRDFLTGGTPPRGYIHASRDRIDEFADRERAVRDARYKYIRSWAPEKPTGHRLAFRDNQDMMREMWRLLEDAALDPVQRIWFEPTGAERLYDTERDPHEVRNLVDDPAHQAVLARMRNAYESWYERVPDWSDESEAAMIERMWPGGEQPVTADPDVAIAAGRATLRCDTPGASIGYRVDDGAWQVYGAPVAVASGSVVRAKAVRYGYQESDESVGRAD